jgi:hypothetical protein
MPIDTEDFYDPIEDALVAAFADVGDHFAGVVVRVEQVADKYGTGSAKVLRVTLQLDDPFEDDDYVHIYARSKQLLRQIGRAVHRASRRAVTEGDWMRVEYVEEVESNSGGTYKVYDVEYEARDESTEKSIGTGEFGENGVYQPSLFEDDLD